LGLTLVAIGLVSVGIFLSGGSAPVVPTPTTKSVAPSTTVVEEVTTTLPVGAIMVTQPDTLDPYGEGGESDQLAVNLTDGDVNTEWRTEHYLDPITLLKPGVGVTVRVQGTPSRLHIVRLSEDSDVEVYWSDVRRAEPADWERIAGAHASPGSTTVGLPPRHNGFWLIWLTKLTPQDDGTYLSSIAELRFDP
jgi:hypothetical protein